MVNRSILPYPIPTLDPLIPRQVGITFIPNSPRWLVLRSLRKSSLLEVPRESAGGWRSSSPPFRDVGTKAQLFPMVESGAVVFSTNCVLKKTKVSTV